MGPCVLMFKLTFQALVNPFQSEPIPKQGTVSVCVIIPLVLKSKQPLRDRPCCHPALVLLCVGVQELMQLKESLSCA